jgi:ABC-type nitrate/sulfonate/bicarbonate transport system permease component
MTAARARLSDVAAGMAPLVLLVALWFVLATFGFAPAALLPAPQTVLLRLSALLVDPQFVSHCGVTLYRLFTGFALAAVIGIGIGIAAAGSRAIRAAVTPLVRVLAPLPKIALYPAFVLTLGFEHSSKIALVVCDAVFPILLATFQGAMAVEPKLVWSARAAGVSHVRCLFSVVLRSALPSILTGCRISLVIACIVVFLAEMITSSDGLGHMLVRAARNFQTVDMFVPIIAISLLGLVLNAGFNLLRARLLIGYPEES